LAANAKGAVRRSAEMATPGSSRMQAQIAWEIVRNHAIAAIRGPDGTTVTF